MQKFEFLRQPLLGELAMSWREERRKKEKEMPFIVATYVYASSQGQRTHSAQTKINSYLLFGHCIYHTKEQLFYFWLKTTHPFYLP